MSMTLDADINVSRCCLDLVRRVLPVESVDRLLTDMAGVWSAVAGQSTVLISCVCGDSVHGLLLHQGQTHLFRSSCSQQQWSAAVAVDGLAGLIDEQVSLTSAMTVVLFETARGCPGGVLLPGVADLSRQFGPLPELCAALIEQVQQCRSMVDESEEGGRTPDAGDVSAEQRLLDAKLEAMAEFAAGAGHEINNPVATIAGRAALLLKSETDPERRRALETIGGQAYRIRDMIGDAMTFARPPEPQRQALLAAEAIHEVIGGFGEPPLASGVRIETSLDDALTVDADPEQFRVVIASLLKNALEALSHGQGGCVSVSLSAVPDSPEAVSVDASESAHSESRDYALLTVTDDGPGLSDDEREHLFDPFYSGRQAGRGLGFGLSRCWRIVRLHGGRIEADCPSGDGLQIRIHWPVCVPSE